MATSSNFTTSNKYILYDIVVTENSTSIPNNTSSINVKVRAWRTNQGYQTYGSGYCIVNIDGEEYFDDITPDQVISYESDTVMFDRTVTIPHNADGKKTIYVSAYFDHSRFSSNSQGFNVTLSTIPRQANLVSAPNFYDTDNPTIQYSNPAGNISAITSLQACISLTGAVADVPYRNISKTGTSYTFNLTQAERNTLLAACPNSNTLSVRFIVRTVLSGQTYYSTLIRTMTVKNANPTITGASYADTNATTTAITNNNQQIIQGNSTVRFTFSSLAALKYATLSKVEITVNAVKVTSNLSGSSVNNKTVDFGTINSSSNLSASIKLTDSRGNSTTQSLNITLLAWSLPTAIISLSRKSNYYDETYLKVNADYSSLDNKNSITIQYQYKERSGSTWSALTTIQDDVTETISLDNTKAFDFKIIVTDRIGSTTYNAVLQIGIPIIYFDRLKRSVGIGTIPSETNQLAVDRRVELKNTLQETVADFWATVINNTYRSAFLLFRNQNNVRLAEIGGSSTRGDGYLELCNSNGKTIATLAGDSSKGNGYLRINDVNGTNIVTLGLSTGNGGWIGIRDSSGNTRGAFYAGSYGGVIELNKNDNTQIVSIFANSNGGGAIVTKNSSGNTCAEMYCGNNNAGYQKIYDSSGTNTIFLAGQSGNITCISLTQTSSRKVKDNIKPMNIDEARKILGLQAVSFDFKDKAQGTDKRGFIAEDVAEVIPELVTPETETEPAKLDYIQMIPYLLETIKNQERRIQDLEAKIEELSKKLT